MVSPTMGWLFVYQLNELRAPAIDMSTDQPNINNLHRDTLPKLILGYVKLTIDSKKKALPNCKQIL